MPTSVCLRSSAPAGASRAIEGKHRVIVTGMHELIVGVEDMNRLADAAFRAGPAVQQVARVINLLLQGAFDAAQQQALGKTRDGGQLINKCGSLALIPAGDKRLRCRATARAHQDKWMDTDAPNFVQKPALDRELAAAKGCDLVLVQLQQRILAIDQRP